MLFPVISLLLRFNLYHLSILLVLLFISYRLLGPGEFRASNTFVVATSLYVLFLLYAAISLFWSPSTQYATFKFVRFASVCLLLIVAPAVLFPRKEKLFGLFKLSIVASIFLSVVVIIGYLSPEYSRSYYLLGASSHLATGRMLGFGIVATTYYVLSTSRTFQRYTYGLMLIVLLLGIAVSESRGPLVAAGVSTGLLIFLVLYFDRDDPRRALLFLLASLLAAVSVFVLHAVFGVSLPNVDRIIPLLQGDLDPSNVRRLDLYRNGVLLWLESPIIGSGLGSYGIWIHGEDIREFPHNFVLELLAELGVIGLLLFGALLCVAVRPLVSNHRDHPVVFLLFCLLVYALVNASLSEDLQGDRMIFALVGLSTCVQLFREPAGKSIPVKATLEE